MPTVSLTKILHGTPYGASNFQLPSYWDVTLEGNAFYAGTFDAWCVNPTKFLNSGHIGALDLYSAYSSASNYSALNTDLPATLFAGSQLGAAALAEVDNVNWLLNQHFTAQPQFSVSEVQLAMWRLLGFNSGAQYLTASDWQESDVQSLVNAASVSGEGFVPGANDVFALFGEPQFDFVSNGINYGRAQPIVIETQFAKLGNYVWEDSNLNGLQDPAEAGVDGVQAVLTGTDAFGATVSRTTFSGDDPLTPSLESGFYLFERLLPGNYQVTFSRPDAFLSFTLQDAGANALDTLDSDANPLTGSTGVVLLKSGDDNRTLDAGLVRPASLGDRIWLDSNGNGQQDDGATGLAGLTVTLAGGGADGVIGTLDDTSATTLTGADGFYQFTGLTPGVEYQVSFNKPTGTTYTARDVGADASDSDADPISGKSPIVVLASGENNTTLDAGVINPTPGIEIIKDASVSIVAPNTPVTYTYSVRNTGGVALSNIVVKDDHATPGFGGDDFNPTPVSAAGFNVGDLNQDNKLDLAEVWKYSAAVIPPVVMTVTPVPGGQTHDSGLLSYQNLPNGDVRVFYRQGNAFNDNTYGTGTDAGWTSQGKTHKFSDLTGSDKAGFEVRDTSGKVLFKFYQDYVTLGGSNTEGYTAFSGYQSLGYSGGDGSWVGGVYTQAQAGGLLSDFDSTIETNLNQAGLGSNGVAYTAMTVNSPVNDAKWDAVNGYSFVIKASAFNDAGLGIGGFGGVRIFDQHNSPAKTGGSNSYIPVIESGASVNTATVVGTASGNATVQDSDTATVVVVTGPLGSLGDRVWLDSDADGVQDAGETGLSGVKLTLSGDFNNDGVADYTATTTTGANGIYTFGGLPAGQYTVAADPTSLSGTFTQTYDLDGTGTAHSAKATLTAGQTRADVDFGYVGSNPGFTLQKLANKTTVVVGEEVTYSYTVSNTTGATISNVQLKDDNATTADLGDDFTPTRLPDTLGNNDNLLEPGEVWSYQAKVVPPVEMTVTIGNTVYDSGTLTSQRLLNGDFRVTYRQNANFNDNTYGTSSDSGWTSQGKTHKFSDLTGSDKAGFELKDANGVTVLKFYQDYITLGGSNTEGYNAFSGYQSLGVSGGDGSMLLGNAANLYDFDSTLETNLNRPGYTNLITNSPLNDPNWDAVDGYSFTVKAAAFGNAGFGGVSIFDQHNSPAKVGGSNSYVPVVVGGPSTNTATVTGLLGNQQLVSKDDATVLVTPPGGGGQGAKFFVVDAGADDVFPYSAGGSSIAPFSLHAQNIDGRGITGDAAGTRLWVLDKNKTVYVYAANGSALGSWTAGSLGREPEGIAKDGNDIWIVDREKKSVFWYDNAASNLSGTDAPEKTFALPIANDKPKGLTTDGTYLWVVDADAGADTVFRYLIQRDGNGNATGLTPSGSWTLDARNSNPTGITLDPSGASQSLWVVDSGTKTVYEYANARTTTSGSAVASKSFVLAGANGQPQDIFDPLIAAHAAGAVLAFEPASAGSAIHFDALPPNWPYEWEAEGDTLAVQLPTLDADGQQARSGLSSYDTMGLTASVDWVGLVGLVDPIDPIDPLTGLWHPLP